uniref:Peptidase C1A papain C-terminal domain-containing protein n=1 Tax=Chromera velia CCMP2878 TaxID=1169474 RepID=A0A0G4HN78_9ALVE|eukprot:Cvel_7573.t1-p1 / transcript=Cvel_7573.t1 / gene=Cvel_7573 / organism=Chromera_velia_CCMP2878 / gene_product=Cathepsin K, putative / transcript_product=Cathepsin K, putative / location=Cvel_scaffold399:652-1891(+) / protein_length=380 / sequence_SO=supercontig / SO=protein_coding / is_pseudo=false
MKDLPSENATEVTDVPTDFDADPFNDPPSPGEIKKRAPYCTSGRLYCWLLFALVPLASVLFLVFFIVEDRQASAAIDRAFDNHVRTHKKQYASESDRKYRRQIFGSNMQKAAKHNQEKKHAHNLSVDGPFADLTFEEFLNSEARLPASVDRRTDGCVAPVRDQGTCGSCWAFATADSLYSFHCQNTNQESKVLLSIQQLVDCSSAAPWDNDGCGGGWPSKAFDYVHQNGLCAQSDYPYEGQDGTCKASSCSPAVASGKEAGYFSVPPDNERAMQVALWKHQTVAVCLDAENLNDMHLYSGGVFDGFAKKGGSCGEWSDHCVLVVGYGVEEEGNTPYWLIKNSWGESWGDDGYFKLLRGKGGDTMNDCGVLDRPLYPEEKV